MKEIKKYLLFVVILGGLFLLTIPTFAHPGRTDAYGCHTCRTNCPSWGLSYGEYHCHKAKALPQPEPPIKSKRNGYTKPAPEYESPAAKSDLPAPEKYTAEVPKGSDGGSIWWWVIGIGVVGYLFYKFKKKREIK